MPNLCIIPFRALEDGTMTPAQLRVLCAIGAHTDRFGAGVWASAQTLAEEARCERSTFFRAATYLEKMGFVSRTARWSETDGHQLTSMYRVLLDAPTSDGGSRIAVRRGGRKAVPPKRLSERLPTAIAPDHQAVVRECWDAYPPRSEPHHWLSAQTAIVAVLRAGESPTSLVWAAKGYAAYCDIEGNTGTKFVRSIARFYAEDFWKGYAIVRVYGRTREEWARSGQDVAEFDRLSTTTGATTDD